MTKIAVIGYGKNAAKHISVFRHLDCEIIASCNRSEDGRLRAEKEGQIKRTYSNIAEMLSEEKPDGILCSPSIYENYKAATEVIPFQIPTLLEKPPGISLEELYHLRKLQKKFNTPVMVGLNRLWYSVLHNAIKDAGGLDQISAVFVEWSENPKHLKGRGFTDYQISRRVFSNSLHGLSLLSYLAGKIKRPKVTGINHGEPFQWVMSLQGISEKGVLAGFNSTWDSPGPWRFEFCIRGRRYSFAPIETCSVYEQDNKNVRTIQPENHDLQYKPGYYYQAKAFLEMVKTRIVPENVSLEAAIEPMRLAQKLTDACIQAGKLNS